MMPLTLSTTQPMAYEDCVSMFLLAYLRSFCGSIVSY